MEKKELNIYENFFDYIKDGIKTFEIRKDPNLEGIVDLIAVEHNWDSVHCFCEKDYIAKGCIKKRITVKLTKEDVSVYEIAQGIQSQLDWLNDLKEYEYLTDELEKELKMLTKVDLFLLEYTKNNEPIYWYDLEIIKE